MAEVIKRSNAKVTGLHSGDSVVVIRRKVLAICLDERAARHEFDLRSNPY